MNAPVAAERKKRSITEIRDSKKTGEKMVYTSVLDYTSAKWAEAAGDLLPARRGAPRDHHQHHVR
jgi:hypothetical protein